jgi:predicted Na+-dependent transporter
MSLTVFFIIIIIISPYCINARGVAGSKTNTITLYICIKINNIAEFVVMAHDSHNKSSKIPK